MRRRDDTDEDIRYFASESPEGVWPKVQVYRPLLTPEEFQRRLDQFADGLGKLLHCKVTITRKTDIEE